MTRASLAAIAALLAMAAPAPALARRASRVFRTARFELTLPPGWSVAEPRPDRKGRRFVPSRRAPAADARIVHFADGRGDFLSVFVDHATDFETDAVWNVRPTPDGGGVEVTAEGAPCVAGARSAAAGPCSAGNGTLEIGTIPALRLRGHAFAFQFGNTRRERGVDLDPFRWILQSFRAR